MAPRPPGQARKASHNPQGAPPGTMRAAPMRARIQRVLKDSPVKCMAMVGVALLTLGLFRDCRLGSKEWKQCGGWTRDSAAGDFPRFDLRLRGGLDDTLYQGGVPKARLIRYRYRVMDDEIYVESLDGERWTRYCSK